MLTCPTGVGLHRAQPAPRARRRPEAAAAAPGPAVRCLFRRRREEEPLQVGPSLQWRRRRVRFHERKGNSVWVDEEEYA